MVEEKQIILLIWWGKNYNFNQYVTEPTTKNQTTIDLVFSNYPHQNTSVIDCYWSAQNLLYTVINTEQDLNKV